MRLIRKECSSERAKVPRRAFARKSKRSLSSTLHGGVAARRRISQGDQSPVAIEQPRNGKSKNRAASAGGRQYRKSIDRIVKSPAK